MHRNLEVWLRRTAYKNLWRAPPGYTHEDLIQDGRMCYQHMLVKYDGRLDISNTRDVTNLFKRIFANHIYDMSSHGRRIPTQQETTIESPEALSLACEQDILASAVDAPEPIKSVLRLLVTKPELLRLPLRVRLNGVREHLDDRIRRQLKGSGVLVGRNIMHRVKVYLQKGYDPLTNETPIITKPVGSKAGDGDDCWSTSHERSILRVLAANPPFFRTSIPRRSESGDKTLEDRVRHYLTREREHSERTHLSTGQPGQKLESSTTKIWGAKPPLSKQRLLNQKHERIRLRESNVHRERATKGSLV